MLGSYWVGSDVPPPPVNGAPPRKQPLILRCVSPSNHAAMSAAEMLQSPPSSAVRVHVHKHSRAPAFSLMLGNWTYLAPSRSSLLLAPKKVHLHVTVKSPLFHLVDERHLFRPRTLLYLLHPQLPFSLPIKRYLSDPMTVSNISVSHRWVISHPTSIARSTRCTR
jgi:hypothetical protein